MNERVYQAWAKAIVFLILAAALFVLGHGYPLAKVAGYIWLGISFLHMLEAWGHMR